MKRNRPNIIYILADDQGYGDVSCLNENSKIKTPHMDEIARSGMKFTDAHSSSAVCTPSRYSILTGRYNWRSPMKSSVTWGGSRSVIEENRLTVPLMLKEKNYNTACIGKWHLGWEWGLKEESRPYGENYDGTEEIHMARMECIDYSKPILKGPCDRGFDRFFGIAASLDMPPYVYVENRSVTALPDRIHEGSEGKRFFRSGPIAPDFAHEEVLPLMTGKALDWIEDFAGKPDPFFLYFPLPAPHTPILPTEEFRGKSGTNEYGDFVLMCDDLVGRIRRKLEDLDILENTILIYTSDNGCSPTAGFEELGRFGHNPSYKFRGHKADIFEGGHRIPLLIQWPELIEKGSATNETVCLVDLMATLAEIIGYDLEDDSAEDSVSNLTIWKGEKRDGPLREATVHHSIDGSLSIRQGKWKLEFCPGSGGWSFPEPGSDSEKDLPAIQLYDLDTDLGEKTNLADSYPEIAASMSALMIKYVKEGRSTPGAPRKNSGPESWPQLERIPGYI